MAYDFLHDHSLYRGNPRNHFNGHPITTDQMDRNRLGVVWQQLEAVLQARTAGDIVEFGCYAGTTSLFIRRQLDRYQQSSQRAFHVYDSFAGLPDKGQADQSAAGDAFQSGMLRVSKHDLIKQFKGASLRLPVIHKSWFDQLNGQDLPPHIAFAFLDGDFYQSIIDSLRLVWPRLVPGGLLLVDDYKNVQLPGVEQALQDFFRSKSVTIKEAHNVAIVSA